MGLLWDIVDAVIDWRIERRRRLPVVAVSELLERCPARNGLNNRCALSVGHAEQHRASRHPAYQNRPRCSTWCMGGCTYPKCLS